MPDIEPVVVLMLGYLDEAKMRARKYAGVIRYGQRYNLAAGRAERELLLERAWLHPATRQLPGDDGLHR